MIEEKLDEIKLGEKLYVDKTKFYDVGTYNYMKLDELFVNIIPVAWNELLDMHHGELRDAGLVLTKLIQKKRHQIVPHPWNVFRALALTPPATVKVVIIGQDPYFLMHGDTPAATGLCFECAKGMPVEKSLSNIILVLKKTIPTFQLPASGDLTKWAEQGVLLLNASLTTSAGEPNVHAEVWEFFPKRVLEYLGKVRKNVVYMLWGKFAQNFRGKIDENDNLVLEASHPVARGNHNTFFKCDHFNEANFYLTSKGLTPIDWNLA